VSRCGALSLLQKTPHYRGNPAETAARLKAKLWVLTDCVVVESYPLFYTVIKSRNGNKRPTRSGPFAGHLRLLVCASVLRTLPPAAPPASPVAPALAPARGMIGRILHTTAPFLCLLCTMDSQPTDEVEGGQDKTPTQKKRNSYERTVVKADTPTATIPKGTRSSALHG
jgi:hypothetical protein